MNGLSQVLTSGARESSGFIIILFSSHISPQYQYAGVERLIPSALSFFLMGVLCMIDGWVYIGDPEFSAELSRLETDRILIRYWVSSPTKFLPLCTPGRTDTCSGDLSHDLTVRGVCLVSFQPDCMLCRLCSKATSISIGCHFSHPI